MTEKRLSRREFFRLFGVSAAGLALSGCSASQASLNADGQSAKNNFAAHDKNSTGEVLYRTLAHTNTKVSTIGIGASYLREAGKAGVRKIFDCAADRGVNLLDTIMSDFSAAYDVGEALRGKRNKFITQMHIGATYPGDQCVRSRNISDVRAGFEKQLRTFQTDYSDIGLIHYVDIDSDYDAVVNNGLLDYAQQLKKDGVIRNIGFSSHSVDMCNRFLDTGLIDVFMFSMNPAYDFVSEGSGLKMDDSRIKLYERAQRMGVGITVMKTFAGGRLLSGSSSPFGRALTLPECIQYCLDRPGVVSVLPGIRSANDLEENLRYYSAPDEARNYSVLLGSKVQNMEGVCIYCGHCGPCAKNIDIASVNKFYDLSQAGDALAKDHYMKLERKAGDCIACGQCEPRCPFHVEIRKRMRQTQEHFGN